MAQVYVEIVKDKGNEVVKRMGPMGEQRADRVADGASINLNWDEYSVRIVPKKKKRKKAV